MSIQWETKKTTRSVRQIGKCGCGSVRSRLIVQTVTRSYRSDQIGEVGRSVRREGEVAVACEDCGGEMRFRDVKGTYCADKPCNARCTGSRSGVCECSCGGKNHGAAHA